MTDHRPDDTGTGGPRRDDADGRTPPAPHPRPGEQWVGRPARPADHEPSTPATGPATVSSHFGASSVPPHPAPHQPPTAGTDGPWTGAGVSYPDGFGAATGPQGYGSPVGADPRTGPQPADGQSWAGAGQPADGSGPDAGAQAGPWRADASPAGRPKSEGAPPSGGHYTEGTWSASGPPVVGSPAASARPEAAPPSGVYHTEGTWAASGPPVVASPAASARPEATPPSGVGHTEETWAAGGPPVVASPAASARPEAAPPSGGHYTQGTWAANGPPVGASPAASARPEATPPSGVYHTEETWAASGPPVSSPVSRPMGGTAAPYAGLEIAPPVQYPVDPAAAARAQPAFDAATPQGLPAPPPPARPERSTGSEVVIGRTAVTPSGADGTVDGMARRVAVPAVTATPLAATAAVAARDLVEHRPDDDTPPEGDAGAETDAWTGPTGRMPTLHIGRHLVRRSTLARMSVPAPDAGLVLGRDRRDAAVPMRLFAPAPVRVALVGGVWAAQLLIFRAFALGARVTVVTSEPASWIGFGERATGQYDRLTVLGDDRAAPAAGTAQQPILSVYDLWEAGPATTTARGPWRSQLTILRQLDRPGVPALQDAQYTLLQRLGGEEAALATSALRLRRHTGQFLQFMADDMLALVTDGADRYFSVAQTPVEHDHVGPPRR